jgi:hypothetical protein
MNRTAIGVLLVITIAGGLFAAGLWEAAVGLMLGVFLGLILA